MGIGPRTTESAGFRFELKRRLWIWRHTLVVESRSWRTWVRILMWGIELVTLIFPVLALGVRTGIIFTGVIILSRALRAWNQASPAHMQLVRRNYKERKIKLYTLLQELQRREALSPLEVLRFQQETLALIANYARDHRADTSGTQIFANLLRQDGDDLVVVARDLPHRDRTARYPKATMLAGRALDTSQAATIGDLYLEYPETPKGKQYRSIMVIPLVDEEARRTIGVVSIDSSRPYHFESDFKGLVHGLMPYVGLLAWTLRDAEARRPTGS